MVIFETATPASEEIPNWLIFVCFLEMFSQGLGVGVKLKRVGAVGGGENVFGHADVFFVRRARVDSVLDRGLEREGTFFFGAMVLHSELMGAGIRRREALKCRYASVSLCFV